MQLIDKLYNTLKYTLMSVQFNTFFSLIILSSAIKDTLKDSELNVSLFLPLMQKILTVFSK